MFPKSNIQRDKLYYPSCYCAHGNNGFLWIYSGWYEFILNKDCRMTNKQKWKISRNRNNAPNDHLKGVNASSVFLTHIRQTNCCWQKNIQITSLYISPGCGSPWGLHLSSGWSTMHLAEMYFISFPEFPELFLFKSNVHYVKTKQHLGLAAKGTAANTPLNSVVQISM